MMMVLLRAALLAVLIDAGRASPLASWGSWGASALRGTLVKSPAAIPVVAVPDPEPSTAQKYTSTLQARLYCN